MKRIAIVLSVLSLSGVASAQPRPEPLPPPAQPALPVETAPAQPAPAQPASAQPAPAQPAQPALAPAQPPAPDAPRVVGPLPAPHADAPPPYRPLPPPSPSTEERPARSRQLGLGGEVGTRFLLIRSAGFDPFAESDLQALLSLGGSATLVRLSPVTLAAVGGWDFANATSRARGIPTSLAMHRLWAGLEGRYALAPIPWLVPFVRVTATGLHERAELDDPGSPRPLVRRPWSVGADASLGARALLARIGDDEWPFARMWVGLEAGYAYAPEVTMSFAPKPSDSDPRETGTTTLPSLRPGGPMMRVSFAMTF